VSRDGGLRPLFALRFPTWHWVALEVAGLGRGVPDAEYAAPPAGVRVGSCNSQYQPATTGWCEFKQTATWSVDLRPEQVAWCVRRARAGGRVTVAVRRKHLGGPRKGLPVDQLWLVDGALGAAARAKGLVSGAEWVLGWWDGGPRGWDWGAVEQILRRST